jgi:hypothetical protein
MAPLSLDSNEIESANRSEVTALLIRCGYRVYRPEADTRGEDLVVRTSAGDLISVQLKSRLTVDLHRYGGALEIWMLFPDGPFTAGRQREWFLVPHRFLFDHLQRRHGKTPKWNDTWSKASPSKEERALLKKFRIHPGDVDAS